MKAKIVEISGYLPAIVSLYTTGKNVTGERLADITKQVDASTDRWGRVINATPEFTSYMEKIVKYGVLHKHETILDFINISVFMKDLHRGGQDYSLN